MISDPLPFLKAAQSKTGGWGYQSKSAPIVEPTSAVIIALNQSRQEMELHHNAISWLLSIQRPDGGWGINAVDPQSGWMTAWGVWALSISSSGNRNASAGADWLLKMPVMQISNLEDLKAGEKIAGIDFSLRGWSWQPGEASWVEPTALAVLALASQGVSDGSRLSEATSYLVNRRCPGGGWNVGNPIMFGSFLPPRAQPTAMSLMALYTAAPAFILEQDFSVLETTAIAEDGAMALGWAGLALAYCGKPSPKILTRLAEMQKRNGSWDDNPYITAIAWLAFLKAGI